MIEWFAIAPAAGTSQGIDLIQHAGGFFRVSSTAINLPGEKSQADAVVIKPMRGLDRLLCLRIFARHPERMGIKEMPHFITALLLDRSARVFDDFLILPG